MLFTVCFFVHVSHCMSSVSLSVGVVIVEASELSAESDRDLCETGEMNSFSTACSSCFTVFPAVQQKHNYLASFSSRLRRFSLSSKVFFSLSASLCLSASSLWRRRWVSSRLSQKARGCLRYTTFLTFSPWDNIFESNVSSPCFPPGCQTDSVLQPNTESVLQLHWGTKGFYVQVKIKHDSGHPLE